jgi:hypothetical protein
MKNPYKLAKIEVFAKTLFQTMSSSRFLSLLRIKKILYSVQSMFIQIICAARKIIKQICKHLRKNCAVCELEPTCE